MKLPLTLLLFFFYFVSFSQRSSIDFGFKIGSSVSKHKILDENSKVIIDNRKINNVNDKGVFVSYNFLIWKKAKLYISLGADFSETKHSQGIIAVKENVLLDIAILRKKRIGYNIGLNKTFQFKKYNKFSLTIGAYLYFKYYNSNKLEYTKKDYSTFDSGKRISYDYQINTFHEFYQYNTSKSSTYNYSSSIISTQLDYKTSNNISIFVKFDLLTYVDFYSDLGYEIKYYSDNNSIPYLVENHPATIKNKNHIVDDYIHFSIGISLDF